MKIIYLVIYLIIYNIKKCLTLSSYILNFEIYMAGNTSVHACNCVTLSFTPI